MPQNPSMELLKKIGCNGHEIELEARRVLYHRYAPAVYSRILSALTVHLDRNGILKLVPHAFLYVFSQAERNWRNGDRELTALTRKELPELICETALRIFLAGRNQEKAWEEFLNAIDGIQYAVNLPSIEKKRLADQLSQLTKRERDTLYVWLWCQDADQRKGLFLDLADRWGMHPNQIQGLVAKSFGILASAFSLEHGEASHEIPMIVERYVRDIMRDKGWVLPGWDVDWRQPSHIKLPTQLDDVDSAIGLLDSDEIQRTSLVNDSFYVNMTSDAMLSQNIMESTIGWPDCGAVDPDADPMSVAQLADLLIQANEINNEAQAVAANSQLKAWIDANNGEQDREDFFEAIRIAFRPGIQLPRRIRRIDESDIFHSFLVDRIKDYEQSKFEPRFIRRQIKFKIIDQLRHHIEAQQRSINREESAVDDSYLQRRQEAADREPLPDQTAQNNDDIATMKLAIGQLNEHEKKIIQLKVYEEMSFNRMSEVLSIPASTLRRTYNNAMKKIGKKLKVEP